jgi:hypothetical protein
VQFLPQVKVFWRWPQGHGKLDDSVSPKVLESRGRQLRESGPCAGCSCDQKVVLDRTRIVPVVGKLVTCGVTEHVRMDRELQARMATGTGHYLPHGRITQRAATFADEHIGRAG